MCIHKLLFVVKKTFIGDDDVEEEYSDNSPTFSAMVPIPASATAPSPAATCWSETITPVTITEFSQSVGPTFAIPDSPLETFQHFITDSFIADIVLESNRYAQQVMAEEEFVKWVQQKCLHIWVLR